MKSEYNRGQGLSSPEIERAELLRLVDQASQRLGTRSTLFTAVVAAKLGINATDFECLDLLGRIGPLTAGQLAEHTGLSTGAITGVVDRLERAGYAERARDAHDRRKVIVKTVPQRMEMVAPLFASLAAAIAELNGRYSDGELALIHDYATRSAAILEQEAARLQVAEQAGSSETQRFDAPLGEARDGRLVFASAAVATTIRGRKLGDQLFRAQFSRRIPDVDVNGGAVTVQYRNLPFLNWLVFLRESLAVVTLNTALPWTIELRAGASKLEADLRGVELRSFEIGGSASDIQLALPRPAGVVPIDIAGGAGDIYIERPAGVAVRLHVHAGVSSLAFDGRRLDAVAGDMRLETLAAGDAGSVYEITIGGGANKLVVKHGKHE